MSQHLPDGAGYLREGAEAGLWRLMTGNDVPDVYAAAEVIVAGGVRWSMYDVLAFRAFAERLRLHPQTVYVVDLDDAANTSWEDWSRLRFPRVTLADEAKYQPPVFVRYKQGSPDVQAHGHTACQLLADGGNADLPLEQPLPALPRCVRDQGRDEAQPRHLSPACTPGKRRQGDQPLGHELSEVTTTGVVQRTVPAQVGDDVAGHGRVPGGPIGLGPRGALVLDVVNREPLRHVLTPEDLDFFVTLPAHQPTVVPVGD